MGDACSVADTSHNRWMHFNLMGGAPYFETCKPSKLNPPRVTLVLWSILATSARQVKHCESSRCGLSLMGICKLGSKVMVVMVVMVSNVVMKNSSNGSNGSNHKVMDLKMDHVIMNQSFVVIG